MRQISDEYKNYLLREYVERQRSTYEIAAEQHTYPNRIRRDLNTLRVQLRDKSAAQSAALATGRHKHPTKGRLRSEEDKLKISTAVAAKWNNLSDEEKHKRISAAKARWDSMSDEQREEFRRLAAEAVRRAATEGSKLEKFLLVSLKASGFEVLFHKIHTLSKENIHIDLLLPTLRVAIEVDGPTHFLPIWGEERLSQHILADQVKTGLLLNAGYVIIRIKNLTKNLSDICKRKLIAQLTLYLDQVKSNFPEIEHRLIEIELS